MADQRNRVGFAGRMVIVGFGSIGQGVLPLLLRHMELEPSRITIVTGDERGREEAEQYGIAFFDEPLTRENYRRMLEPLLGPGDFLLNVSVDVSSVSLMELCAEKGALYLDTCIEPCAPAALTRAPQATRPASANCTATTRLPCRSTLTISSFA